MPITFSQLATNKVPVVIDFGDGATLQVSFYPQRITGTMLTRLDALDHLAALPPEQALVMITGITDILLHLLADWDLVESIAADGTAGPPVPLDREHVDALGVAIQIQILNAVMGATRQTTGEALAPVA